MEGHAAAQVMGIAPAEVIMTSKEPAAHAVQAEAPLAVQLKH